MHQREDNNLVFSMTIDIWQEVEEVAVQTDAVPERGIRSARQKKKSVFFSTATSSAPYDSMMWWMNLESRGSPCVWILNLGGFKKMPPWVVIGVIGWCLKVGREAKWWIASFTAYPKSRKKSWVFTYVYTFLMIVEGGTAVWGFTTILDAYFIWFPRFQSFQR